jgi:dCTP deaminase
MLLPIKFLRLQVVCMGILSDQDILDRLKRHRLSIEPFNENQLTPNGYDLSIAEIYLEEGETKIREGVAEIPPQTWFAVSTREYVKLSGEVTAQLWLRTSHARKGIQSTFGKIDAGFEGTLTFSAFNASKKPVTLSIGDTFAQLVLEEMLSIPRKLYAERSGKYQGQRGVTLDKYE